MNGFGLGRMGLGRLGAVSGAPSFSPASLFANGEKGIWIDPSDLSTLFQDSGMTTPVTATGQTVAKALDKSGNGLTVTFSNCTLEADANGSRYIAANGTTSTGNTASIDFTGTDKLTFIAAVRATNVSSNHAMVELSTNSTTATGAFLMYLASSNRVSFLRRSANVTLTATGKAPTNIAVVYTDLFDIGGATATDEIQMQLNGAALSPTVSVAGPAGSGNFGNYPIYLFSRGGSSLRFAGGLYQLIGRSGILTGATLADAGSYSGNKAGFNAPGTRGVAVGDSTIAAYLGTNPVMDYVDTTLTKTTLADPGDTINDQRIVFASSLLRDDARWAVAQIGLNDLDPAEAASVAIARLQTLVDVMNLYTRPATKIFISKMIPCRTRLINLYGGTNGPIAYAKWQAMNDAIAGLGPTPITGVDGRITAHEPLMNDGSGNLAAIYDTGDGIHPNNAGREVIGNAWEDALRGAGLI